MIFDFDDFYDANQGMSHLEALRECNAGFKCTVFAVPAKCSAEMLVVLPPWIEVAVHGLHHNTARESEKWTREDMHRALDIAEQLPRFVKGFKAPGWQISDACYDVLNERGYWVADQPYNNDRRPGDLPSYVIGEGSWHGHIQNVCGNGLVETFPELHSAVCHCGTFQFVSEAVQ